MGITLSPTHVHSAVLASATAIPALSSVTTVEALDVRTALDRYRSDWTCLGQDALQGNPVADVGMTAAAVERFIAGKNQPRAVLVWAEASGGNCADLLIGVFVCCMTHLRWGVPVPVVGLWRHAFTFAGLPLIHAQYAEPALSAFFRWLDDHHKGRASLLLEKIPGEGPFFTALQNHLARTNRSFTEFDRHERAALRALARDGDYFSTALSNKKRKEYRRLKKRLGERGVLSFETFDKSDDVQSWCDAFLKLEAAGWKGTAGTALAAVDGLEAVVRQGFATEAENGTLLFWQLCLDGVPVAMACGVHRGSQAWLLKIAHDEAFAKFSPGVLLILELTRSLVEDDAIDWVDSCADADHPMIDHLWRERMSVADVLIAGTRMPVPFKLLCELETLRRIARSKAARLYQRLKKGLAA